MKFNLKLSGRLGVLTILTSFIVFIATLHVQAQTKEGTNFNKDSLLIAAREIIGAQKYCALITVQEDGTPQVRTMNPFLPEEDMSVWIATNSKSGKVEEIRKNPNVTLYYSNHTVAIGYVSIKGKAILVDDMAEKQKRKREYWAQAFPDWKYLILIKVIPEKLEVINYKHKLYNDPNTFKAPSIEFKKE